MKENWVRDLQIVVWAKHLTGSSSHEEYIFGFLVCYSKTCFQHEAYFLLYSRKQRSVFNWEYCLLTFLLHTFLRACSSADKQSICHFFVTVSLSQNHQCALGFGIHNTQIHWWPSNWECTCKKLLVFFCACVWGGMGEVCLFCNYFKPLNLPTLKFCAISEESWPPMLPHAQVSSKCISYSLKEFCFLTHSSEWSFGSVFPI